MQKLIDIIIFDYLKFFGFISGIRNEYFNYYETWDYILIFIIKMKDF